MFTRFVQITVLSIAIAAFYGTAQADDPGSPAVGGSFSSFVTESFQTDLTTGAATASVPIVVPPGRKGIQPNLALSYSSNNGNSWCGVGWSLDVGSIQRSTKGGVPTYDNPTDTFVFSGAELVDIGGNEYRAKIESQFMKFIYDDINDHWTVYDKGGTKYMFGESVDSKIGNGSATFKWSLNKVIDIHSNFMTFHYETDQNHLYLHEIKYTGNANTGLLPSHEVVFNRETRTDAPISYRSGYPATVGQRLKNISVYTDAVLNWEYIIAYDYSTDTDRSLMRSATLKDAQGNSLPPKTFTYQSGGGIN